ncbi:hypothetical protein HID58_002479, partial [Brassica napus]
FVSAQSGDTDKAKKIREAAIFTISFVACDSPFGNQLLLSIFKALRTFCAYQTLSFSSNAFRALIYIESLEPLQPPFPTPPSTLSALEEFMGITILLLDELGADLLRRGVTRHDASSFTILETLMNHKDNIRALPPLSLKREEKWSAAFWKLVTWSLQDEDGTRDEEDEEKCYLEYPNVEDVDNISVALIYATTVLELPNKY